MKFSAVNFKFKKPSRSLTVTASSAVLAAAVMMVAQADEHDAQFKRRVYVGAGVGASQLEPKTNSASLSVSENTDAGFHVAAGFDFTTRLSAEIYYADLGAANIAFLNQNVGEVDYQVFGLSAIVYLVNSRSGFSAAAGAGMARREGLSVYGRAGIGGVSADSNLDYTVNNSTHLALGLGAEYGFRNGFALRGEYMALDTDQQYASLSIVKRFGKSSKAGALAAVVPAVAVAKTGVAKPVDVPAPEIAAIGPIRTVNFAFDQSVITPDAASILNALALAASGSSAKITLEGHTDWIDTERYNYDLSLKRAESVRRYLETQGISRTRMSVRGFGEERPIATNATDEGRASNRRVDIRIN